MLVSILKLNEQTDLILQATYHKGGMRYLYFIFMIVLLLINFDVRILIFWNRKCSGLLAEWIQQDSFVASFRYKRVCRN